MTLEITYDTPVPAPDCGYIVKYRRYGASSYTEVSTSGSTVTAGMTTPACIEGTVQSDCCEDNLSVTTPFGINSYQQIFVEVSKNTELQQFQIDVTSEYGNPYDTVIAGTIFYTAFGDPYTEDYEITYPADSTEYTAYDGIASETAIITGDTFTCTPVFSGGMQIQQFDSVNTPNYFQFITTSGSTWDGSPTSLPSFTTNALIGLEVEDDIVTQANLLCSWIYDSIYEDGIAPYDAVILEVYDEDNALIGELRFPADPIGLRNITIFLQKADRELNTTNEFTMVAKWDDDSVINTLTFTLPEVTL